MVLDRVGALQPNDLVVCDVTDSSFLHFIFNTLFLIGMIFPLSRSLRGISHPTRLISTSTRGNKTSFAVSAFRPTALQPLLLTDSFKYHQTRKMSQDVPSQSDITVMKLEPDGSFKRAPSSFRNFIQKGGRFPPEKGTSVHA